jgi:hypothetical protein
MWKELAPNSPDLNPCDVTEDMCRQVINITIRVEEVAGINAGHIQHLIHRG